MTAPTLIYRDLTLTFARSVTFPDQIPQVMEVTVIALDTASSAPAGATFIDGPATQEVVLSGASNTVTYGLVPTDLPGLDARVLYRIAWRQGISGRTFTYDFAMPDADVDFEDLSSLGNIIDGETYLQQSDLGVPGRVARLNSDGAVVDSNGVPVAGQADISGITGALNVERVARQQGDADVRSDLEDLIDSQFNQAINTAQTNLATAQTALEGATTSERNSRIFADNNLQTQITALSGDTDVSLADLEEALGTKLDADDPSVTNARTPTAHKTSHAVGGTDPLTPGDIGAAASTHTHTIANVTGLQSTLDGKPNTSVTDGLDSRLDTIEGDTTIVRTSGGVVDRTKMGTFMAFIDDEDRITKKDGTVLGGAGGAVSSVNTQTGDVVLDADDVGAAHAVHAHTESDITGLAASLAAKVDDDDSRLTDDRDPNAHAASHADGGTDEITVAQSQVTGLAATLTNHGNRLSSLETRVTDLELGGGGPGGGGSAGSTVFYSGITLTEDFTEVDLHSPFGYDTDGTATGVIGHTYHDPAGAESGDVRFPYITPNGHLELREWNESNPADPELATQADVDGLTTVVNGKANSSTVATLQTQVDGKADQADLLDLQDEVALKAYQSAVDTLSDTVDDKADQSSVDTLTTLVDTKAAQSDMTTVQGQVTTINSTLPNKADLSGGFLASSQIPSGIAQSKVTNLPADLAAKANLSGGFVVLSEIPSGIPTAKISGLDAALTARPTLDVNGQLSTSVMPALALTTVQVVANRAAMLALSQAQVQPGDICVITATVDQGTYILAATDPSSFTNWQLLQTPLAPVLTVNGQTGTVVLNAAAVGALAADATLSQSQVTGLVASLAAKVDTSTYTAGLATKTSTSDVQALLSASVMVKQRVSYVATTAVASLSGQQSVDGVLMALGSTVLVTAQASSTLNGIWQVNSGAWTRVADMASGSYLVKGTVVTVASGNTNANTLWQVTTASGVVDSAANNWTKIGNVAAPVNLINGNGIAVTGTYPDKTLTAVAASGGGCQVTSSGIGLDTAIAVRKFTGTVAAGSATPTITHGLGTTFIMVQVIEVASGIGVWLGWTATGANTVQLEFSSAPSSGQWKVIVIG